MKRHIALFLLAGSLFLFGFILTRHNYKPIESLIRPPKIAGENSDIQSVFESNVGEDYLLKSPISGEYRTSFIRKDINSDGIDEVFVFYCKTDKPDVLRINVLKKNNDGWSSISDIESVYSEIYQISFADLDNDKTLEIIFCWRTLENEISNTIDVYKIFSENGIEGFKTIFSKAYSEFVLCDVNADKKTDIILFEKSTSSSNVEIKGSFYDFNADEFSIAGEFFVDPAISTIGSVCTDYDKEYGDLRIYIDGYKTDTGITTDLVVWDNYENAFVKPEYDEYNSVVTLATRSRNIYCADINSDSIVEIPLEDCIEKSEVLSERNTEPDIQSVVKWVQNSGRGLIEQQYEIFITDYSYSVKISPEYFGRFTVKNHLDTGELTFYMLEPEEHYGVAENKKPKKKKDSPKEHEEFFGQDDLQVGEKLFTIFATSDFDYGMYELSGYRLIASDNGFNYYYQIFDAGKEVGITKEIIKSILLT